MSEKSRSSLSRRARGAVFGLAAGLLLLLSGDKASTSVVLGIDPLEILKLQVRPNVLLTLDSSGSMRESLTSPVTQLGDDHSRAKMKLAKDTLRTFIQNNQTRVSFQFGIYNSSGYDNPAGTKYNNANSAIYMDPADNNRFLYSTEDPLAAAIQINQGGSANSNGKLRRLACTDLPDVPGEVCEGGPSGANDFAQMDIDNTIIHLLRTKRFFNGQTVRYTAGGVWCSTTAGVATSPPTVQLQTVTVCGGGSVDVGLPVTFTFHGRDGDWNNPSSACAGFFNLVPLRPCNDLDQFSSIGSFLQPSILMTPDGLNIQGYADSGDPDGDSSDAGDFALNVDHVTGQPTSNGIRAGGFTPVGNSLADLKAIFNDMYNGGPLKPPSLPTPIGSIVPAALRPRTYVIFVTDGDDTCLPDGSTQTSDDGTTGTGNPANQRALHAAWRAQNLYQRINAIDPASGVETFVILFGSGASKTRGDWIAYGGSGMVRATVPYSTASRWGTIPTAAEIAACSTCRPAYTASNAQDLAQALQDAISQSVGQGEFSASPPIVSTIFELVKDPDGTSPFVPSAFDPDTRYAQRVNILFQSTWELPFWKGRLFAFRNDGTFLPAPGSNALGIWEAGQTLFDKVTVPMRALTGPTIGLVNHFTFAELHGGATVANIATSSAAIKRRIFTTARNGTWVRNTVGSDSLSNPDFDASRWDTGSNVVALWPPNQAGLNTTVTGLLEIDPPSPATPGPFDDEMGIATLTFPELQALGACSGQAAPVPPFGGVPAACTVVGTTQLEQARKEARQIVLAWMAGATWIDGTDGKPLRTSSGELLYTDRDWILGDTVLAAIAVATPPLRFEPSNHISEFTLYRDGRRDAAGQGFPEIHLGVGLRNPDFDDANPETKASLKPVMTVVYLAANDMLHAFRAGPQCPPGGSCLPPPPTGYEQGSEELWAFLPYDQLAKPLEFAQNSGQRVNPHTYVLAASVRVASLFLPSQAGFTVNGAPFTGRWRTVLFFGRGPGGRHLSAIDVTSPGPFTEAAAATNPPWVMWNRGNPDTQDGTPAGTQNNDLADFDAYLDMGQTWSIPAIGNVSTSAAAPCDDGNDVGARPEWRLWVGSGYADNAVRATEGKRFFMLDALTGNVCRSWLLGDGDTGFITHNAIVAPPSGYNPRAQDPPGVATKDPVDRVTRVYIPDLHGRLWRYSSSSNSPGVLFNAGSDQPFADGAALLKVASLPRVFLAAGNDNRVPESEAPFRMFGLTDTLAESTFVAPGTIGTLIPSFTIDFPSSPPSNIPFRGTLQPATAFNSVGQGRVFYAGTRFNPAGLTGSCVSSFDTILFAVSANTGGAVYDFTGDAVADLSTIITGTRATGLSVVGGSVVVGDSGSIANAPTPTPDPSPTPTPPPPLPAYVTQTNLKTNSPVCRTP
jgi:hypothetical protein